MKKTVRLSERDLTRLVKRVIRESEYDSNLMDEIMKMEEEFNNDSLYKEYEKMYMNVELKKMISKTMGLDASQIPDEMLDMFSDMLGSPKNKPKLTPELIMKHKDGTIKTIQNLIRMTNEDEEYELSGRLNEYMKLLKQL
jgi:hypothetical protein